VIRLHTLPALLIALYGAPVAAQMVCGPRAVIVMQLDLKYGETRRGSGVRGPSAIYEVWANCDTGSWSILKTTPNGWACAMAVGDNWTDRACEKGRPI